jgi:electron transport complex protein RnfD
MENIKIIRKTAPYLRRPQANVTRMMRDVVIALLPVTALAIWQFGLPALWILLVSVLSMVLTEYVYYQIQDIKDKKEFSFRNESFTLYNFSAIVSGLIYGLTLPDSTPLWVVAIGGILGIYLAKLIYGGMGQNIFNVAAIARLLLVVTYGTSAVYELNVDAVAGATALGVIGENPFSIDVLNTYPILDLFSGIGLPGSLGEVSGLLLILGGAYLAFRTSFEVRIPLMFVGTVAVLSLAVGIMVPGLNALQYMLFHVFSGGLLFGAIFMATDPITSPITKPGRVAAGFMMGAVTFIIRVFGAYPEGVVFSIVLMNLFVPTFDYFKWSKSKFIQKRVIVFLLAFLVTIAVVLVGVHYAS